MIWHWPQILVACVLAVRAIAAVARAHTGEKLIVTWSPAESIFAALMVAGVLYAGGFWGHL